MFVLTSGQMRLAEEACVNREGITYLELMERAGSGCAEIIMSRDVKNALVVCGKGKNGGDGFVIARKLCESGFKAAVLLACGKPKAEDAVTNFERLDTEKIPVYEYDGNLSSLEAVFEKCDTVIDCVFGTGFSGSLSEPLTILFERLNSLSAFRVAVDVPTGAESDGAPASGTVFKADLTIAISALKPVHIFKPVSLFCGKTVIADIGITNSEHKQSGCDLTSLSFSEALALLPKRPAVSNKGTFGHVLNVCGSMRMQGAAVLAAKGAVRMGAGLVTAAFPDKAYPAVASKLTEPLMLPLPSDENGFFTFDGIKELLKASKKATAILIGCGIGLTEQTKNIVYTLIEQAECPVIIDADGINAVSANIDILKAIKHSCVVTPHPGEMSRLTGKSIAEILKEPVKTAYSFANKYNVTVALKTANTVVCSPGCPVSINSTGNTALSKGGSGDLLAGMTASLVSQGMSGFDAARTAVFFHGRLADKAADFTGKQRILTPSDLTAAEAFSSALSEE